MRRCYNSGKIGGLFRYQYKRNFLHADMEIARLGYEPVNPLHNGLGENCHYWLNMAADIAMLLTCRTIYMQRNWQESRGARIEHRIAKFLRIRTIYQQ